MRDEKINHILATVKAPINHPLFFTRIFTLVARLKRTQEQKLSNIEAIIAGDYDALSRRLDRSKIQESVSVRNMLRTRQIAEILISDKGEINTILLPIAIERLQAQLYSLGPDRQYDAKRQEHLLNVIKTLQNNKDVVRLLQNISRPLANKHAEDLIRETLKLAPQVSLSDAHAKRAVLSAWICYLRQNVGSCFATAPAEVIHDEQPELFLQDMADLLATGRLKRTFAGIEYVVPLSASWGNGELRKPLVMQRTDQGIRPEIWFSPGLMEAFQAAGLLKEEDRTKHKAKQLQDWLIGLFNQAGPQSFFIITAEEIIRKIMLQSYGLTEQNIKEYEERPRSFIQSHLLMQVPETARAFGGIGERCASFLFQFETAKNAFKSLTDNALLKSWEFTLASFSETKLEFTRWNLYASLGMETNEPGGIGQRIYQIIEGKVDEANRQAREVQYEYEMVYTQVKTLESRMRLASTEKEGEWLKMEYQSRINEFYSLEEQRNAMQRKAKSFVHLYDTLYNLYIELFKDYFQEVYDADMQEITIGPFDDSPAGFRLIYKHGRSNTSQWTRIKGVSEFIDSLVSFFSATEPQILSILEEESLEKDLADVVTDIINHIKTKEFIESAFYRMAIAHNATPIKDPLEHLEYIEKKPWVYTSGGTMNTLVSCYFRIENRPKEVEKWVENELELLVFLADTLKQMPYQLISPYLRGSRSSMLMQSPTHAFLLKPAISPFNESWTNEEFTYTYIRDSFVRPSQRFIEGLFLNEEMLGFLIERLAEKIPDNYRSHFRSIFNRFEGSLNPVFFREYLMTTMEHDRGLNYKGKPVLASEEVDSFLYSHLPLFPIYELRDCLKQILALLPGINAESLNGILELFDRVSISRSYSLTGANQLQDICKALMCLSQLKTTSSHDYPFLVSQAAQKLGYAMPAPIIFADTNWVKDFFGFAVNPGTSKLELWRFDYTGSFGYPMTGWKEWLNGSRPDRKWSIYVKPTEYGQV